MCTHLTISTIITISLHLHSYIWMLRFKRPNTSNNLLRLLSTQQLRTLMQLICLIIIDTRISSKMLFRIFRANFLTIYKIIWNGLNFRWWWHFWSLVLVPRNLLCFIYPLLIIICLDSYLFLDHLIYRTVIHEIVQIELLMIRGDCVLSSSMILKAILRELWVILEVLTRLWTVGHRLLFSCFNRIEALSSNIFFLFLNHCVIYVINGLEFHLSVGPVFISGFRTSLSFVITSIYRSQICDSRIWWILINGLSKLSLFNSLVFISWRWTLLHYFSTMLRWRWAQITFQGRFLCYDESLFYRFDGRWRTCFSILWLLTHFRLLTLKNISIVIIHIRVLICIHTLLYTGQVLFSYLFVSHLSIFFSLSLSNRWLCCLRLNQTSVLEHYILHGRILVLLIWKGDLVLVI